MSKADDILKIENFCLEPGMSARRAMQAIERYQEEAEKALDETVELPAPVFLQAEGYERLADVLHRAFEQASAGKGKERHAKDLPFHEQPMQKICELYGVGFALGQAAKKAQESQRLPHDRAVAELLGAINYIAGAVIFLEKNRD